MADESTYSGQPAESSPQPSSSGSSDAEAVKSYFLNRAAVAEAMARNYEAEADIELRFGTYIPAATGAIVTATIGIYAGFHRTIGIIWLLAVGVAFLIAFLAISFWATEIARSQRRKMASTLRNLAKSLKTDAS